MARRAAISSASRKWLLGGFVSALAIAAIALTLLALNHVAARPTDRDVAPIPTFSQPARDTPSPSPSEATAPAASYDRSQERFLTVSAGVLWRGTAGQCGVVEPLLERSADGGQTWADVTPRYLGIGQLVALNPFADGQAEIVALMGATCELQALRTFTQGQFWEASVEALTASNYVDPVNPGTIVRPGSSAAAPCTDARNLRTSGATLATVCDGTAYVLDEDSEWRALLPAKSISLSTDDDGTVVAHISERCSGVALTNFASTRDEPPQHLGCAPEADATAPSAIVISGEDIVVWSKDVTTTSTR